MVGESSNRAVPAILAGAFEAYGKDESRTAVVSESGSLSWREFTGLIDEVAEEIQRESESGPVGILLPSGESFLSVFLAAATVGRPACTLHPDWAEPELEAAITDAGLSVVFTDREQVPEAPNPANPIPTETDGDDPVFYIGFTSGTSGRPKPFLRRQKSWSSSFEPAGDLFSVRTGDVVYLPGSLQHSHFLFGAVFALNRGASVRMFERFDAGTLLDELQVEERGAVYLVPTMLLALDEQNPGPLEGVHSVVISGAKMEAHHWEIARRIFPRALVGELYGASELSFVSVNTDGESPRDHGYVGRPFPGVEIEIRDEAGAPGADTGLVWVRSPYLFEGYLGESGVESPIGADGCMTVGDVGSLGPDGLSLSGRASNMVITGGKNVHPEEVEARLAEHPDLRDCVVAGVPHARWGEEIVAFVVFAGYDQQPGGDDLKAYLRGKVASYKIPKRWFRVEAIPLTRAGKTDRSLDRLFEGATEI
jgi:long-chain acyl-CoA synthetase